MSFLLSRKSHKNGLLFMKSSFGRKYSNLGDVFYAFQT